MHARMHAQTRMDTHPTAFNSHLQETTPAPLAFTGETIVVNKEALKPYLGQVCVYVCVYVRGRVRVCVCARLLIPAF